MEHVPKDLDAEAVKKDLESIKGIISCEDFHIWSIGGGKTCLTAHLKLETIENRFNSHQSQTENVNSILSRSFTNYTNLDGSYMQR